MSVETVAQFDHHGVECRVLWVNDSHYCGYVGVPRNHPWFGKDYDALANLFNVEAHGGLTYSDDGVEGSPSGRWWVGFDTAHAGDVMVDRESKWGEYTRPYDSKWRTEWTQARAEAETQRLAAQAVRDAEKYEGAF